MRLATIRREEGLTRAVRLDDNRATLLEAADVGEFLSVPGWEALAAQATGETLDLEGLDYAPLISRPDKIICVGLNYRLHIEEGGRDTPQYPMLFAKYRGALIGAFDDVVLPEVSDMVDWEAELAIVIGSPVRRADEEQARQAIAGFTVINDVSVRDWQWRTRQLLQGKTFESTSPLGPWLVTSDDSAAADGFDAGFPIGCEVDGAVMQEDNTANLLFSPVELVRYVSQIITLLPGDVIATGTPSGVGGHREPPVFLQDGQVLVTRIAGIGECRNVCRREKL